MAKEKVEVLIEGGKATAAPPLGPALGPMGVNIGQVVADINKKTADFKKMQVPVIVTIDTVTKEYEIEIGTPPASALIKKEAGITKGSSNALKEIVADISLEQVIKVTKMKSDALLGNNLKNKVKEIVGTCRSVGISIEGNKSEQMIAKINAGEFDSVLNKN
jgi:large subunit ribosomal protein L11